MTVNFFSLYLPPLTNQSCIYFHRRWSAQVNFDLASIHEMIREMRGETEDVSDEGFVMENKLIAPYKVHISTIYDKPKEHPMFGYFKAIDAQYQYVFDRSFSTYVHCQFGQNQHEKYTLLFEE